MNMRNLFLTLAFGLCSGVFAQNTTVFESPIMGWSSWNTYRVHINDTLIIRQADAMVQKGLKEVGYSYVNVDDGFFGWRDEKGVMQTHPERFPERIEGSGGSYSFFRIESRYLFGCGKQYLWFYLG